MNLPNKLTLLRIVLVPIILFIWLFPYNQFEIYFGSLEFETITIPYLNLIVLAFFIIASLTDMLDGNIARRRNLITTFGKFADPIADKLLVNSFLIILAYKRMIPVVPVVIMLSRDTIVDGCRMIAASKNVVIAAGIMGKLKTVLQILTICVVLLNNFPFELYGLPISTFLIWFTSFISLTGGISYFIQVKSYIFESI